MYPSTCRGTHTSGSCSNNLICCVPKSSSKPASSSIRAPVSAPVRAPVSSPARAPVSSPLLAHVPVPPVPVVSNSTP